MEQNGFPSRRFWRILLLSEAALCAALAILRLTGALSFRLTYLPLTLMAFLLLDAAVFAIGYDRRNRTDEAYRGKRRVWLLLIAIALIASVPLFTNYLPKGHDIQFHLFRIEGVRDGLYDGQFPVRIHPNTLFGNGYANPIFYPELLLYFPALLRLSGFSVMAAYKTFVVFLNLLTAILSYYACSRIFRSVKLGLIGSAFYTLSLYRLVNLYTRAAIGEASAMAFLPLVAVGMYAILFDETDAPAYRRAFLPLLLGMTGLVSTHLLSCEIALPLLAVCCLVFARRTFTKKRLTALLTAAAGTLLLTLAFLVPMLDFMGYDTYRVFDYSTANLSTEAVNLAQLFPLFPDAVGESNAAYLGAKGEMPLGIGFVFLCVLLLYPALRTALRQFDDARGRDRVRLTRFCYVASVVLLLMSTNLFPWTWLYNAGGAAATVAGMLQFPWRLLSLSTLLLTFVACRCFALLPRLGNAPLRRAIACALALFLTLTTAAYMDALLQTSDALFIHSNADLDQLRSVGDAEYLPSGTSSERVYTVGEPTEVGDGLMITEFVRRGTSITFTAENASGEAQTADLPLICYLGYVAEDGAGNPLPINKGASARIRVTVPAGYMGPVSVRFVERPLWRAAEAVTLLTAILLIVWYVVQRRKHGADTLLDYGAPISILE